MWEIDTAEAIVADLYMRQGLGGEPQFQAPEYRLRLVSQIAGILGERKERELEMVVRRETGQTERVQQVASEWKTRFNHLNDSFKKMKEEREEYTREIMQMRDDMVLVKKIAAESEPMVEAAKALEQKYHNCDGDCSPGCGGRFDNHALLRAVSEAVRALKGCRCIASSGKEE